MTLLNEADKIYLGTQEADAVYAGAVKVWPTAPVGPTAPANQLLISFTPGADRADFTGGVGTRLGFASNFTCSWLGARCGTGMTGPHTIKINEWFTHDLIATGVVNFTGKTAGEYAWVQIPSVTLLGGGYYSVLLYVTAGENWANTGETVFKAPVNNTYNCYEAGGSFGAGAINQQYVGIDLGW